MVSSLSQKVKKVIDEGVKEFMESGMSLGEAVRAGARMLLASVKASKLRTAA